jgi:hypothetical protein
MSTKNMENTTLDFIVGQKLRVKSIDELSKNFDLSEFKYKKAFDYIKENNLI